MKKIFKTLIFLGLVASTTSCKKYLDINTSPNSLTAAAPDLILPQALVATGSLTYNFSHTYGGDLGGYIANSGGVGGYGNFWTFVFNSGDFNTNPSLWGNTYDNLQDYQFVIDNTTATGNLKYFNAVARVMKSFDFLRLVDAYGDVPYSQALKGAGNLTPVYDKAQDVYKGCITELDAAIAVMNTAPTPTTVSIATNSNGPIDLAVYSTNSTNNKLSYNSDPVKNGLDMTNWIKFANTIKLRALIRIQKADAATYGAFKASMSSLTTNNFIAADVMVNPGYLQQSGKQNPFWNGFAYSNAGVAAKPSYLATKFVMAFYNGNKLSDDGRGKLIYRSYTFANQLGFQSTNAALLPTTPDASAWYVGVSGGGNPTGTSATGFGVLKGFDQGIPLITAAESYFLQSEAAMIGLITGVPSTLFDQGVTASFAYLDKDHNEVVSATAGVPATQYTNYKAANVGNAKAYLTNYTLATTDAQRLEAIITQKYIALNMINNDEGWNEYRRTLYPVSVSPSATQGSADPVLSFAPAPATITTPRSDGLAGRILYPASETSYNKANVPTVNANTSLIFWDARPTN
ncbi:MAG: SusD/RagB family nutrient-binding outer membrane lipoprotein [Bacteroidota bacterium]